MLWRPKSDKVRRYKRIREAGSSLNDRIVKVIPKEVIERTAREMRLMAKGVLVFDSEGELDFLFDRIIYDVPWDSRRGKLVHIKEVVKGVLKLYQLPHPELPSDILSDLKTQIRQRGIRKLAFINDSKCTGTITSVFPN